MKKLTRYHKRMKLTFAAAAFLCCFLLLLVMNSAFGYASQLNYYVVKIDGEEVGTSNSRAGAEQALLNARLRLSNEADSIVYVDSKFTVEEQPRAFGKTDDTENLSDSIYQTLKEYTNLHYVQAILLYAGNYSLMVDSEDTADKVLQALLNKYDTADEFDVRLQTEQDASFTGITYEIFDSPVMEQKINALMLQEDLTRADASAQLHELTSVGFTEDLEIRSVYTDASAVLSGADAVDEALENGSAIGVITAKTANYDEDFEAPIQYVQDDSMYEGRSVVEKAAVPGQRNVTAVISYRNGEEDNREILEQTVYKEPEAAIIRTGTVPAPTFVQPLDNCFLSSGFGYRWGALHQGNDYACGYGEPIYASCAGEVIEVVHSYDGYGFYVMIRHDEHLVTRYAHMSETACSVGQQVRQYEVIGYAGSTGNSTGNHCHFEILENGVAVDPFTYLN